MCVIVSIIYYYKNRYTYTRHNTVIQYFEPYTYYVYQYTIQKTNNLDTLFNFLKDRVCDGVVWFQSV